jgi:hypothetical protein
LSKYQIPGVSNFFNNPTVEISGDDLYLLEVRKPLQCYIFYGDISMIGKHKL